MTDARRKLTDEDETLIRALIAERTALIERADALAEERERCIEQAKTLTLGSIAAKFEIDRGTLQRVITGQVRRRK